MRRSATLMTESFTLSLFVYPQFLCTTFAASWLFVPEKAVGGPGGLRHGHVSHFVFPKTVILDRLEQPKKSLENRKHLLRRASNSQKKIASSRRQIFLKIASASEKVFAEILRSFF